MWNEFIASLQTPGRIEFGAHQLERNEKGKIWRRHDNRSRFENLSNALFSDKGAYAACTGTSDYPKRMYSATGRLIIPYAAAWIHNEEVAILVRSATPLPEAVLINSALVENFSPESDIEALQTLACLFGRGAEEHGVRWLTHTSVEEPVNLR
jgi:DNA segregation ATPase FtsK/SpoIIIE-like protein